MTIDTDYYSMMSALGVGTVAKPVLPSAPGGDRASEHLCSASVARFVDSEITHF